jgi:hypothetical protein
MQVSLMFVVERTAAETSPPLSYSGCNSAGWLGIQYEHDAGVDSAKPPRSGWRRPPSNGLDSM